MGKLNYRIPNTNDFKEIYVKVTDTLPIGAICQYGGSTAPSGYLMCNGQAVSRTTYADLFKAIGTSFGSGDGVTTFNVPNFNGKVPVGLDGTQTEFDTLGETGGSKYLQEHTHSAKGNILAGGMPGSPANLRTDGNAFVYTNDILDTAGTGDSGNLQPYLVVNYIIKASKKVALDKGNVVDSYSTSTEDAYSCDYSNKNMIKCKTVTFNPTWSVSTQGGYFSTNIPTKTTANLTNDDTILSAYLTPVGVAADYSFFTQEFATDFSQFGVYCSGQAQIILTVFYI